MSAQAHGLTEECESMLEATELSQGQIKLPSLGSPLEAPRPIVPSFKANWPVKAASHSYFEKVLMGQVEGATEDPASAANGLDYEEVGEENGLARNGHLGEEDEEDVAGWDMGDDINIEVESDFVNVDSADAGAGSSEAELWARNSPLAADHVAGGSFESAMQLLNRQIGAVNFRPLKPRFLAIHQASKTYLPASSGLPPLINYVRRTLDETDSRKVLPKIPLDLETIVSVSLQSGYSLMANAKLEESLKVFKDVLYNVLINVVSSQQEVEEVSRSFHLLNCGTKMA